MIKNAQKASQTVGTPWPGKRSIQIHLSDLNARAYFPLEAPNSGHPIVVRDRPIDRIHGHPEGL
jgi:hypothetical protein